MGKEGRRMAPALETNDQFLARMILSTREGGQITNADAQRLSDLAQFGPGPVPSTLPEARVDGSKPIATLPTDRVHG